MLYYVLVGLCETKFTVGQSKEMVFTAGTRRGRGELDSLGGIPRKTCLDKTLQRGQRQARQTPQRDRTPESR